MGNYPQNKPQLPDCTQILLQTHEVKGAKLLECCSLMITLQSLRVAVLIISRNLALLYAYHPLCFINNLFEKALTGTNNTRLTLADQQRECVYKL